MEGGTKLTDKNRLRAQNSQGHHGAGIVSGGRSTTGGAVAVQEPSESNSVDTTSAFSTKGASAGGCASNARKSAASSSTGVLAVPAPPVPPGTWFERYAVATSESMGRGCRCGGTTAGTSIIGVVLCGRLWLWIVGGVEDA